MKRIFILFLVTSLTSACSLYRIDSQDVTANYYSPKTAHMIKYVKNVTQPHEVIGYVTVNTERSQSLKEIVKKMQYEAGILGGDAITNITSDATGTWKKLPVQKFIGNAYVRANFKATVIVFK